MNQEPKKDFVPGDEKLMHGHDYDGIQELDNDLPTWWLIMFWGCIVWGVLYMVYVHCMGKWGIDDEYKAEVAAEVQRKDAQKASLGQLSDAERGKLLAEQGKGLFAAKCAVCHRADGGGTAVFPNLSDDVAIYGFNPEDIKGIITKGSPRGMPPQMLNPEELEALTAFVISLKGTNAPGGAPPQGPLQKEAAPAAAPAPAAGADPKITAALGKAGMCAGCHQSEAAGLGPSLKAIQARLGKDEALFKGAVDNILNGTIGKPSQYGLPATSIMPPNNAMLSREEAELILRHLLATGKLTP
ncbi:MAG: hypothetical protein RL095_3749 [Verrucomicrobiota bacterium]|jgi:cytochrome c oxidase cbb3-type subunit 3